MPKTKRTSTDFTAHTWRVRPVKANRKILKKGNMGYGVFGITTERRRSLGEHRLPAMERDHSVNLSFSSDQIADAMGVQPHEIKGVDFDFPSQNISFDPLQLKDFFYVWGHKRAIRKTINDLANASDLIPTKHQVALLKNKTNLLRLPIQIALHSGEVYPGEITKNTSTTAGEVKFHVEWKDGEPLIKQGPTMLYIGSKDEPLTHEKVQEILAHEVIESLLAQMSVKSFKKLKTKVEQNSSAKLHHARMESMEALAQILSKKFVKELYGIESKDKISPDYTQHPGLTDFVEKQGFAGTLKKYKEDPDFFKDLFAQYRQVAVLVPEPNTQ